MNKMLRSIWSGYYNGLSPEDMVEKFAAQGWHTLELSHEHGRTILERGNPEKWGHAFRVFAEGRGIAFPQGHLWLQADILDPHNQAAVLDELRLWLDLYGYIGIKAAVLHPGGQGLIKETGCATSSLHERRAVALQVLLRHTAGSDLTICLENIASTAPQVEDLLEIIRLTNHPQLAICLDTGHLNMVQGDQKEFILAASDYLKALHIADNEGEVDQHLMPFGRGNIDWADVMDGLRMIGYQGPFNLEIPGENSAPPVIKDYKLHYIKQTVDWMLESLGR